MAQPYDNRRFRTTVDIVIPAGTLVLPRPDGTAQALSPDGKLTVTVHDVGEAERQGVLRQLAEGQA